VFLFAYTCSGLAGLIYEVSWTRLLTLYIGHTTAAASAVVAAFLGGLAVGAAAGGAIASRLPPRRSLYAYVALEIGVALCAVLIPFELSALTPVLQWAYRDGAPGFLFPAVRLLACLVLIFIPAAALGATFPLAIRWFAATADDPARRSGTLYALNTVGAAVGALLAGFVLIPVLGLSRTIQVGIAGSVIAAVSVLVLLRTQQGDPAPSRATTAKRERPRVETPRGLATVVLGVTGFAALVHEIAWTRILALVLGPTIYAFAATLAAVITGVAIGSAAGTWLIARVRRPAASLASILAAAAIMTSWTYSLAGARIPSIVAQQMAESSNLFEHLIRQGVLLTAALVLPTAFLLGAAFPLGLAIVLPQGQDDPQRRRNVISDPSRSAAGRFSVVYAVNTIGAVSGSLAAGFLLIPLFGLQTTLRVVSGCLIGAALVVIGWGRLSRRARVGGVLASAVAASLLAFSPPWDRELLVSGAYLYAPFVPKDLDLNTLLKAGTLLYYREGASSTVSVKRLTGTLTLAVDGKTDASNRGDMLTQKLVAHLPLLLHQNPRDVAIVGLGSGVTLGAALRHPIARADVVEISREVVEASHFFDAENHGALADSRANLIVGDGRSHLLLSQRKYDVIVSEPSNPWIAGVAALFTREFFLAARDRLQPNGIICQWASAYNISDRDLRAIVATFLSVFPQGTAWLIGADDVMLVASADPLDTRLSNIARNWTRPGVAADLAEVSALEPFSVLSLFAAGPSELARYADSASLVTDDRMTLEFSGPRALRGRPAGENGAAIASLLGGHGGPETIRGARMAATAAQWRNRAAMMARRDAYTVAYDDYVRALTLDPSDRPALEGLVRTATLTRRGADALAWIKSLTANRPQTADVLIAISKLLAIVGARAEAVDASRQAARLAERQPEALEQLASLYAEAEDLPELEAAVSAMERWAADRAATYYYAAVLAFLRAQPDEAVPLALRAIAIDHNYAPVYDLLGAAYTRLGKPSDARDAFVTSLRLDPHDSTAYTNLGLLHLAAGNREAARRYFAEALWLAPDSSMAREGLARARSSQDLM
jgi:spermidine synthase